MHKLQLLKPYRYEKYLLVAVATLLATAYTPSSYLTYDYNESTARNLEPEHSMMITPVIADLAVSDTRIKHVERAAFADVVVDGYAIQKENMENYKKIALSKAAKAYDADVLVASMIDVQTIDGDKVILSPEEEERLYLFGQK